MMIPVRPVHQPTTLRVAIDDCVSTAWPRCKVAVALIEIFVNSNPKGEERKFISDLKQSVVRKTMERAITSDNYMMTRVCRSWNTVFETFYFEELVDCPLVLNSTIQNLLKRVCQEVDKIKSEQEHGRKIKANLGSISNFVDIYNAVSVETMTPMGALDVTKIDGEEITLRYHDDEKEEVFKPLGRGNVTIPLRELDIVYADASSILTYAWNCKDAAHCCVPSYTLKGEVSHILLFADQAEQDDDAETKQIWERPGDAEAAINTFIDYLPRIGGRCIDKAVLTRETPTHEFNLEGLSRKSM